MKILRKQFITAIKTIKAALGKGEDYYVKDGYIIARNSESIAMSKLEGADETFRLPSKAIPLLSAMGDTIEVKLGENEVNFKSGKSRAKYKITDVPNNLLSEDNFKSDYELEVSAVIINNAVQKLECMVSDNNARPVLTGMYIKAEKGTLTFIASDGYRVAKYIEEVEDTDTEFECIVPKGTLKIIRVMGFEDTVNLSLNKNWITLSDDNKIIHSRLVSGQYLTFDGIFNRMYDLEYKIDKAKFIDMLNKAKLVAKSEEKVSKISLKITAENELAIEYNETETYAEVIPLIDSCGEEVTKTLNLDYLRDALLVLFGEEVIMYTTNEVITPLVFKEDKVISLLLPIKL